MLQRVTTWTMRLPSIDPPLTIPGVRVHLLRDTRNMARVRARPVPAPVSVMIEDPPGRDRATHREPHDTMDSSHPPGRDGEPHLPVPAFMLPSGPYPAHARVGVAIEPGIHSWEPVGSLGQRCSDLVVQSRDRHARLLHRVLSWSHRDPVWSVRRAPWTTAHPTTATATHTPVRTAARVTGRTPCTTRAYRQRRSRRPAEGQASVTYCLRSWSCARPGRGRRRAGQTPGS